MNVLVSYFYNSRSDCVVTSRKKLKFSSSRCYDTRSDHGPGSGSRLMHRPVMSLVVRLSPPCHSELSFNFSYKVVVLLIDIISQPIPLLDTMFMKKRRYAELMAELHPQPPTPPTSEGGDSSSDQESDPGDIERREEEDFSESKRARRTDTEDVTMLAELLVEFHNSAAPPPTPPPSPHHEAREAPVRVSVIKHTNMGRDNQEEANKEEAEASEGQESRQQEFTSEITKKTPPTESAYTQKQEIFVKCKNTDREGSETPSAVKTAAVTPPATPSSHNKQRPVILPKMTSGTNVFQSSSAVSARPTTFLVGPSGATKQLFIINQNPATPPQSPSKPGDVKSRGEKTPQPNREKSFTCSQPGCDKSYYKLSHLKAHFRVHTG